MGYHRYTAKQGAGMTQERAERIAVALRPFTRTDPGLESGWTRLVRTLRDNDGSTAAQWGELLGLEHGQEAALVAALNNDALLHGAGGKYYRTPDLAAWLNQWAASFEGSEVVNGGDHGPRRI